MIRAILALAAMTVTAEAADWRFCTVWSREYVRIAIEVSDDPDVQTADTGLIKFLLSRAYSKCLLIEADYVDLLETPESSEDAWARAVETLVIAKAGTMPAVGPSTKAQEPKKAAVDPEWIRKCQRDYRSFNREDGTVIKRGERRRTPCRHKPQED